jgi:hypothetical protein
VCQSPPTAGARRYILLLIDDCNRYIWEQLLNAKEEAARIIIIQSSSRGGQKLCVLRTDHGGEFTSASF